MGKQRRRKRAPAVDANRISVNGNKRKLQDSLLLLSSGSTDRSCGSKSSEIISKISDSDARIRDATLSALSVTLLSGGSGSQGRGRLSKDVLRALSERVVVDTDASCVLSASGCLLNYVQSADEHCSQLEDACSTIVPILLSRIACALQNIKVSKVGKAASALIYKITKEYRIIHIALQVLVTMLESGNNSCLETIISNSSNSSSRNSYFDVVIEGDDDADNNSSMNSINVTRKMTALQLLFYTLAYSTTTSSSLSLGVFHPLTSHSPPKNDGIIGGSKETTAITVKNVLQAAVSGSMDTCARIVHSALDAATGEEAEIILNTIISTSCMKTSVDHASNTNNGYKTETICNDNTMPARSFLQHLLELDKSDTILSSKARLHVAGALTIALHLSKPGESDANTALLPCFVQTILPLLTNQLDQYQYDQTNFTSTTKTHILVESVMGAYAKLQQQQMDEKLERTVTEQQQEGKESARAIARRLYNNKKSVVNNENNHDNSTTNTASVETMAIQEECNLNGKTETQKKVEDEQHHDMKFMDVESSNDVEATYEAAVDAWKTFMFSLSLTLEISTNVSAVNSNAGMTEQNDNNDDDAMEWESNDYVVMEEDDVGHCNSVQQGDEDADNCFYVNLILQSSLPSQVMNLMDQVTKTINYLRGFNDIQAVPHVIFQELFQVQSKCAACLGNMAANMPSWKKQEEESRQIWTTLTVAMRGTVDFISNADANDNRIILCRSATLCSLSRAMVSVLKSRKKSILPALAEQDSTLLLSLLPISSNFSCPDEEETKQNIVVIMGMICMDQHKENLDSLICRALLKSIDQKETSILVLGEILNVLMDIFANDDDACNLVFKSEGILSKFEKTLPTFRHRIVKEANDISLDAQMNLREIALNAHRFIKYKKNYKP